MSELKDRDQHGLHRKTFELTLALYRVTDFFPQGEVLKRQLREKANEIFGGIAEYEYVGGHEQGIRVIRAKVQAIKGYLRVARSMRFVQAINLTILEREYEFLEHILEREPRFHPAAAASGKDPILESFHQEIKTGDMTERQKRILAYVEKTSPAKISDFYTFFKDVSAKTIQRDLHDLVKRNILKKDGEKRWTHYSLTI